MKILHASPTLISNEIANCFEYHWTCFNFNVKANLSSMYVNIYLNVLLNSIDVETTLQVH